MTTSNPVQVGAAGASRERDAVDNLIRRELRVGDPSDPQQIARALATRYQGNARAQSIEGEALGLPFLHTPLARGPERAPVPVATDIDLQQARSDVDMDLRHLLADNLTKDMRPELEGWQAAIQRAVADGVSAARQGLDPRRRDAAFAMRRQLGDYARLARLVGALTPMLNRAFRHLAQSLDEVSAVLLVLMGEAMANLGFAGGRFLLQAPYADLQARRDAVLNALRLVDGVAAQSVQAGAWPRGLRAYRQLSTVLEARGQGDLRSLMEESELARAMDELIELAGGGAPSGLRALGATAWAPMARLHRFVQTTIQQSRPASPELAMLHEALQLFIDGFVPAGGFRLLRVARPAVLNYGLYGAAHISPAEARLITLVNQRGALARVLDCLTECSCERDDVLAQVVLDKMLYDVDRAIDLYCVGDADLGLPETRAAAYSYLIDAVVNNAPQVWPWQRQPLPAQALQQPPYLVRAAAAVGRELAEIRDLLRPTLGIDQAQQPDPNAFGRNWATTRATYDDYLNNNRAWLGGAPATLRFAQAMHDELCLQRDTDLQWRAVIEQMTSGCVPADTIFRAALDRSAGCLPLLLDRALGLIEFETRNAVDANNDPLQVGVECAPAQTLVPPHFEESLVDIANRLP